MMLLHHHVCPRHKIPASNEQNPIEGWSYTIEPECFEHQLKSLMSRGFNFVSLSEYVTRCRTGCLDWGTVTLTFDDGWQDNFDYACPILDEMGVPTTIFVVTGEMAGAPRTRRMSDAQLRELTDRGCTIGAHSCSHANLTLLPKAELAKETKECKEDLEQRLGKAVEFFAYPGGRFNQMVVDATKSAGYTAACSAFGGGANGKDTLFWLYRETFSASMGSLRDRVFLNSFARKLLDVRAQRKLRAILQG